MKTVTKLLLATISAALVSGPVFSANDGENIDTRQSRIAVLESRQTFTSFMPKNSERFHVMHRARDWAVASHELAEMKRLFALSTTIDTDKGTLMQAMMGPSLNTLDQAIERGDTPLFEQTLARTVTKCNACHAATGSDFIQITLDGRDTLSLRHPHQFNSRSSPDEHGYGTPTGQANRMNLAVDGDSSHDDNGAPKHTD